LESTYRAPWWLPGGHLQTIYARHLAIDYSFQYRRERRQTPDGDFIDFDWLDSSTDDAKLLVLFHGLEGCSRGHYAVSLLALASELGWRAVVPHFRGCSGEANLLSRSYHCGDSREIDWILRSIKNENRHSRIYAVGVSLGGNMLLKWLGEEGVNATAVIDGAAAVSVPVDLAAAAARLDCGFKKMIYTRHFLRSLKPKVLAKIAKLGLEIDTRALRKSSTFREFDDLYTAPFHGFNNADDYWSRASSKPWLMQIRVPTLMINARNDPFLPESALPTHEEVSGSVTLDFPRDGGHVGFVTGEFPGRLEWLPRRLIDFFVADQGVNTSLTDEKLVPGFGPPAMT
jgi:hypothetical protein